MLDFLDGSHTETALLRAAPRVGIPRAEAASILATLSAAGFVVDAASLNLSRLPESTRRRLDGETNALALRTSNVATNARTLTATSSPTAISRVPTQAATAMQRRLDAHVLVTGASRLAVPIARTLASSRVRPVHPSPGGITPPAAPPPRGPLPR